MTYLTLSRAAKECGRSKSALLDAIRAGRLSASRNDLQQWQIDPADLFRVYPLDRSENKTSEHDQPTAEPKQNALLLAKIAHLEKQLVTAETDRDRWQQQAERITLLLTHQPTPAAAPETPRPGFWRRLFGSR